MRHKMGILRFSAFLCRKNGYILIYNANPCQSVMASVFFRFPRFSFKVLKSPWYFVFKNFTKSFKKGLVIPLHLWYISVNKNSPRPAEVQ